MTQKETNFDDSKFYKFLITFLRRNGASEKLQNIMKAGIQTRQTFNKRLIICPFKAKRIHHYLNADAFIAGEQKLPINRLKFDIFSLH